MLPRSIALLSILLALHAVGCHGPSPVLTQPSRSILAPVAARPTSILPRLSIRKHDGTLVTLAVGIAATPESQAAGLSGRTELAPSAGLLFVFPVAGSIAFWMHDTVIPLSIAFVDDAQKITDLQEMAPLTDTRHVPPSPIRYAIEANRGFFSGNGIAVGDDVILDGIVDHGHGHN